MNAKQSASAQTRERLIQTAIQTLRAQGLSGLTLDTVAREAKVSKGGLLHHFPSKDALAEAILRWLMDDFSARVQACYDAEDEGAGRWLRAYVRASFAEDTLPLEVLMLLMSGLTQNAAIMSIIQQDAEQWRVRLITDGIPAARAHVIRQAADAWYTERLFNTQSNDTMMRQSILDELITLTENA
jgi:AcrR family transcriptional regulator